MEVEIIYSLVFFLVILQTIVGVGILVVGTPIMLIIDYTIIEAMNLLLPISRQRSRPSVIILGECRSAITNQTYSLIHYNFVILQHQSMLYRML